MRVILGGICALTLAACAAPELKTVQTLPVEAAAETVLEPEVWLLSEHADALRAASCPKDVSFEKPLSMPIKVIEAGRGSESARSRNLQGLTLTGAWQLRSKESNFGGLSGLATMRSGSLLSVSDTGAFVWIGIDPETGAPDGIGSIAFMRGADGNLFPTKFDADAEGLDIRDGLALVSFERDNRVEAFDLESCGAAARGAPVMRFKEVIDNKKIPENKGPEALALDADTMFAGFEFRKPKGTPAGRVLTDGSLDMVRYSGKPDAFLQTGLDIEGDLTASTYRAFDLIRGARVILEVTDRDGKVVARANINSPLPSDNFEGVAFATSPEGKRRIWVISDNNFNSSQRTLLLAFDLED